jgi:ABC-type Na+ efflux pump permease subunit
MWLFKWLTPENGTIVLMVIGMTGLFSPPMSTMRDKIDGGMEFLTALPVERSTLAAARMIASLLAGLFAGAAGALAVVLFGHRLAGLGTVRLAVASFGLISLVTGVGTALTTGMSCRMEARNFSKLFLVFLVAFVGVGKLAESIPGEWKRSAWTALGRPWFPEMVGAVTLLVSALLLYLSYHMARTGLERFTPGRDRITW